MVEIYPRSNYRRARPQNAIRSLFQEFFVSCSNDCTTRRNTARWKPMRSKIQCLILMSESSFSLKTLQEPNAVPAEQHLKCTTEKRQSSKYTWRRFSSHSIGSRRVHHERNSANPSSRERSVHLHEKIYRELLASQTSTLEYPRNSCFDVAVGV